MIQPFLKTDVRIVSGEQGLSFLRDFGEPVSESVVIASTGMIKRLNLCGTLPSNTRFLSAFSPNPTVDDLLTCLKELKRIPVKRFICIGGGSAIDIGKAISAILDMGEDAPQSYEDLCKVISEKQYLSYPRSTQLLAVPTTAGTGADVTQWATVWDMRSSKKLSVDKNGLAPDLSLIIPEFTAAMSPALTLSTGLDALAQAMESFWSRARTPLSQVMALDAVRHIRRYLPLALKEPDNIAYREGMCMGALLSGIAFSKTRTTACHSISYPITMEYGTAHGFAVAVTLEAVAEINYGAVPEISKIYEIFGGKELFRQWLKEVSEPIQPLCLSAFGVVEENIPQIAAGTFTQGRMDNNPVLLTKSEVEELLRKVL